jgi:hypothetical protein
LPVEVDVHATHVDDDLDWRVLSTAVKEFVVLRLVASRPHLTVQQFQSAHNIRFARVVLSHEDKRPVLRKGDLNPAFDGTVVADAELTYSSHRRLSAFSYSSSVSRLIARTCLFHL